MNNKKIDRRKNYYIVIDTETYNTIQKPIVYDIGFIVIDKKANIYEEFSFLVKETWENEFVAVQQAHYYEKNKAKYFRDLRLGNITVKPFFEIWRIFMDMVRKYNVKAVIAHNMTFDNRALNITTRKLSTYGKKFFFPKMPLYCTMKMAEQSLLLSPSYQAFCLAKPETRLTPTGKFKKTAEVLYQYVANKPDFIETHKGLEDTKIESQLFAHILRQKKAIKKEITFKKRKTA